MALAEDPWRESADQAELACELTRVPVSDPFGDFLHAQRRFDEQLSRCGDTPLAHVRDESTAGVSLEQPRGVPVRQIDGGGNAVQVEGGVGEPVVDQLHHAVDPRVRRGRPGDTCDSRHAQIQGTVALALPP